MKIDYTFKSVSSAVALAAVMFSLAGCGGGDSKPKATQVAAKVNGNEISVHQLNALLANVPTNKQGDAKQVRQDMLEKLIDQQLAYEQAQKKKLDRNPDVVLAIEMAKRDIVARAYMAQQANALAKVTESEIRQYYQENKKIFADRYVYDLQEVSVEPKPELLELLQQLAKAGKSADEIAVLLKAKDIQFRTGAATRTTEQIGAELLPNIANLKDGDTAFIQGPKNYLLVHILKATPAPISEVDATPRIAQFLQAQRTQKIVAEQTKQLRDTAKIQYMGEFANPASNGNDAKVPEPDKVNTDTSTPLEGHLEKGVGELK